MYFVSLGTHMYTFCESKRQGREYMKRDSQVKKSLWNMVSLLLLKCIFTIVQIVLLEI